MRLRSVNQTVSILPLMVGVFSGCAFLPEESPPVDRNTGTVTEENNKAMPSKSPAPTWVPAKVVMKWTPNGSGVNPPEKSELLLGVSPGDGDGSFVSRRALTIPRECVGRKCGYVPNLDFELDLPVSINSQASLEIIGTILQTNGEVREVDTVGETLQVLESTAGIHLSFRLRRLDTVLNPSIEEHPRLSIRVRQMGEDLGVIQIPLRTSPTRYETRQFHVSGASEIPGLPRTLNSQTRVLTLVRVFEVSNLSTDALRFEMPWKSEDTRAFRVGTRCYGHSGYPDDPVCGAGPKVIRREQEFGEAFYWLPETTLLKERWPAVQQEGEVSGFVYQTVEPLKTRYFGLYAEGKKSDLLAFPSLREALPQERPADPRWPDEIFSSVFLEIRDGDSAQTQVTYADDPVLQLGVGTAFQWMPTVPVGKDRELVEWLDRQAGGCKCRRMVLGN